MKTRKRFPDRDADQKWTRLLPGEKLQDKYGSKDDIGHPLAGLRPGSLR
jgi:hypothetical protein